MYDVRVFFRGDGFVDQDDFDDLWEEDDGNHIVDRVVFHPMYDHDKFHYDIAVLHLATPENSITPVRPATESRMLQSHLFIRILLHIKNLKDY